MFTAEQQAMAVSVLMRRIGLGPKSGLRIENWDDRSTWSLSPTVDVTPDVRAAAQAVINAFDAEAAIAKEEVRQASLVDDDAKLNLSDLVRNKSGDEIDKWLVKNVRNVAQARKVLSAIIKFLALPR